MMQDSIPEDLMQKANSPAGQQLLALFQQNRSPEMQAALNQASQGDFSQAKELIQQFLSNPEAAALIQQLRG